MALFNNVNGRKLVLTIILCFASRILVLCQNCGCKPGMCCNQYGYCGRGSEYCSRKCQSGWCKVNRDSIVDIVTDGFFNRFKYNLNGSCTGVEFYDRELFFDALESHPEFSMIGTKNDSKREIAAFFAHFTHDAGGMCDRLINDCPRDNLGSPCDPNYGYYWNWYWPPYPPQGPQRNHGLTSQNVNIDGQLKRNPNLRLLFKAALKFWMKNCHEVIISGQGFGATIRVITGKFECNGAKPDEVSARVQYYEEYCNLLGVHPGTNLKC